ncbi:MAG TPA: BTAD domain-containing putative transcriptional regulator [Acidimicrobiales bacterium]|nr:BTAD domain-containing putative transcriptional regulator [Acidimicrobiales bacterium]
MYSLPPYHVPRRRLTERCAGYKVVVVEAAGGYGKSVLGAELVADWCAVGIEVQLDTPGTDANLLVGRLRAAVQRAGFSDAAAAAVAAGTDTTGAVDALLAALATERCALVVDDAQHAAPDAAALLERIAAHAAADQRLVVLARKLPQGAERLKRAEYFHLSGGDLALNWQEASELGRSGFSLELAPEAARSLVATTGGWTAATVLALARAARTGERAEAIVASALEGGDPAGAVATILEEALASLGPGSWPQLAQVARLPLLDSQVADVVAGKAGFFEAAVRAGVPFTPGRPPWWDLPGPVREHLSTLAPADVGAMLAGAVDYRQRGQLGAAVHLLLLSGKAEEAASFLTGTALEDTEAMDGLELQSIFDQLAPAVVDANPRVLMVVARGHGAEYQYARRAAVLERARELAARANDAVLMRAVEAEDANDLCRRFAFDECITLGHRVLKAAGGDERYTKARCCYALARAVWSRARVAGARRPGTDMAETEEYYRRAVEHYRALGLRSPLSPVLIEKSQRVDFYNGRAGAALAGLDEALALVADRPRRAAYVLCFKASVAAALGLGQESAASVQEVFRVAERFDDDVLRAYGHWRMAVLASFNGDADATLRHVRAVEQHRTDNWWSQASATFLADAAECLSRVGHTELAWEYLARARSEPKDAGPEVALAGAVLEARHGDPVIAEEVLVAAAEQPIAAREQWRVTLLRAYAAYRRGAPEVAGALAARSLEEVARMGEPQLPMICERSVCEQLMALAVATGQPAALALQAATLPLSLCVLGRFSLAEAGRSIALNPSMEAQLLKYVALNARVHAEQVMEVLWPEVGRDAGRNRLRTVLNRLKVSAGNVVERKGEMLVLNEAVRVDLNEFLAEARRAQVLVHNDLALASAVARGAIARYQGDVLPEDIYEDWAEKPRQNARQVMLDLLDMCATEASRRGDLDALRRVVERTIEFAPYDDFRYMRAASALLQQGRRGEALTVVRRARSALAELGLEPTPPLLDLERSIVA